MRCPTCNEEIPNRVEICPACGAAIPREAARIPFLGEADSSTIAAASIVLILAGAIYLVLQAMGIIAQP